MKACFFFRLCVLCLLYLLSGLHPVSAASDELYETEKQNRVFLNTAVSVQVCYVDGRREDLVVVLDRIWQRLDELKFRLNLWVRFSDIARLNNAGGKPVRVSDDVYDILRRASEFSTLTRGAIDITSGALDVFWNNLDGSDVYPEKSEVAAVLAHSGTDKLHLGPENTVWLSDAATRIDLSAVIVGYAIDEASRLLREGRFLNFLVDAGGIVYAAGTDCTGRKWQVNIVDPDQRERVVDSIWLKDQALAPADNGGCFLTLQGGTYSCVIDPIAGVPVASGVVVAAVVAPTALEARLLAWGIFILGPGEGLDLVRSAGTERGALVLRRNGGELERYMTPLYQDLRVER